MTPMIDRIGGEEAVRRLVDRFYDLIETQPQGHEILQMHLQGHGLNHVRQEQFAYLSGFLGGRRYFHEHHGHMDLREIHRHVAIRQNDAEDWLALMDLAMRDSGIVDPMRSEIATTLRRAALMLVNAD